jgi:plastocyanin
MRMKPLEHALLASALTLLLPACDGEDPSKPTTPFVAATPAAPPSAAATPTPAPPLALSCQAEPRSGDTPLTVRFTAFPSGGTGSYDFLWQFGDGATSTARRPAHTYTSPGIHPAALTVTSGEQVRRCDRPITVGGVALPPMPTPPPSATPPDLVITIVGVNGNLSYSPNPAAARVGQRVIWRNADSMTHTATANGGSFDTGILDPGASSAPITMGAPGAFPYLCTIHPGMVGTLTVMP